MEDEQYLSLTAQLQTTLAQVEELKVQREELKTRRDNFAQRLNELAVSPAQLWIRTLLNSAVSQKSVALAKSQKDDLLKGQKNLAAIRAKNAETAVTKLTQLQVAERTLDVSRHLANGHQQGLLTFSAPRNGPEKLQFSVRRREILPRAVKG